MTPDLEGDSHFDCPSATLSPTSITLVVRTMKHFSTSPGINRRGQAEVNWHEGQTEEPKRECDGNKELNEE